MQSIDELDKKEGIKNKATETWVKIVRMHKIKKIILFFNNCISKELQENNNDIEVIVDGNGTLWLNEMHIKEKLGHKTYQPSQTNMIEYIKNIDMN